MSTIPPPRWLIGHTAPADAGPLNRSRHPAGLSAVAAPSAMRPGPPSDGLERHVASQGVPPGRGAAPIADRSHAGDVRHLHAHFCHGATTVTWLASVMTGLPFSFTAHAKDMYCAELNPAGLLRRKLSAARFVVTCTDANRRHLQRWPADAGAPRLPRPQRRARAPAGVERATAQPRTRCCACWRRPPGRQERLRRARRGARAAGRPRRAAGAHRSSAKTARRERRSRAADRARGLGDASTLTARCLRRRLYRGVPGAPTSSACPAASTRTATGTASRTCWSRRWRAACRR